MNFVPIFRNVQRCNMKRELNKTSLSSSIEKLKNYNTCVVHIDHPIVYNSTAQSGQIIIFFLRLLQYKFFICIRALNIYINHIRTIHQITYTFICTYTFKSIILHLGILDLSIQHQVPFSATLNCMPHIKVYPILRSSVN